jgi:hypothetical protein
MNPARIVLTGGPGGGKTTAADLFRRELNDRVAIVSEAATLLYTGGFPRAADPAVQRAVQLSIYHVQRGQEDAIAALRPETILLCDRGTVDGAAYWPGEPRDFFAAAGTSIEAELARYDAVLFFETSAAGGVAASTGNPYRIESIAEARAVDARLRAAWSRHPRFAFVPHEPSFLAKIMKGLGLLTDLVAELERRGAGARP